MPIDPAAVRAQEFQVVFRGYDVEEVDAFLDWIEQELTGPAGAVPEGTPPAGPASADPGQAVPTLRLAERVAEQMLAEATDEAAAIREQAHAEARRIVADAHADAAAVVATAHRRPPAEVEELAAGGLRLRAELDRVSESERRRRELLQTWLEGSRRLLEQRPARADAYRRDTGTTVRRVVTTLPVTAVR